MSTAPVASGVVPSKEARAGLKTFKVEIIIEGKKVRVNGRPYEHTFDAGDVNAHNRGFIELFESVQKLVREKGVDLRGEKFKLKELTLAGGAAYNIFLPSGPQQRLDELEAREAQRSNTLSLNFQTSPEISPLWETVYSGPPLSGEPVDPLSTWRYFWGFRYPLGRTFLLTEADFAQAIYPSEGMLAGVHEELGLSQREVDKVAEQIAPLGWKCQRLEQSLNSFSEEELIALFTDQGFAYGLVHFACHCENPAAQSAMHACLRLKSQAREMVVKLQTLRANERVGFRNQPFVFLNACESQTLGHLLETSSFPIGFLNFKAGGVVATACTIPDTFAHDFAVEFYRRLHDKAAARVPNLIAVALFETRLHFLTEYNNPLGLAYGLYADSYLQLEA